MINFVVKLVYKYLWKPLLFLQDAEKVHNVFLKAGYRFGKIKLFRKFFALFFRFENEILEIEVDNIKFKNPVGLAAGFDYDAYLINFLPSLGFGLHTIGTVTLNSYEGNPKPRLGRLPKSKALLVNKGFKSAGAEEVIDRIKNSKPSIPLGISIGSTNRAYNSFEEQIQEVINAFKKVIDANIGTYFELNISCPNLVNIGDSSESFSTHKGLEMLLKALSVLDITKPVFIKMPLEKPDEYILQMLEVAAEYRFIKGVIFSNLVKDRSNKFLNKRELEGVGKGNFSGKPCEQRSNELISLAYKRYKSRFTIVGCGGIFNAKDAYEKIKRGASLLQLITGMIYEGPQVISSINKGLVRLIKKDGFKNINEAVGSYYK